GFRSGYPGNQGGINMVDSADMDPRDEFQDRQENVDLFAWKSSDMPDIDESVITHKLSISPMIKPVSQRKRNVGEERRAAITEEVAKLKEAGFIEEIKYPSWLANVVMVKKANGKWRMCVDFTYLNKACSKDPYPLPNIDRLIDGASGYKMLSFMDAYSGATYQRLMDRVFSEQIGKNLEVYIEDMVIKTTEKGEHDQDLADILKSVRKYNMRLNPAKCSFGVQAGKFLGFILTHRGIEANPEKCQVIINMRSPSSVKEVQQLTGRIAALSRFLSCSVEGVVGVPPIMLGNVLYLYLAVLDRAMSLVLVQMIEGKEKPIYFVSRTLRGAEAKYQRIERLSLAVVVTARKLRQYFQSHKVVVKTDFPIKNVLRKPDLAGRMVAWSVELSEFDITFSPRGAIMSQILAYFVLEMSTPPGMEKEQPWTLTVDGASNIKGSGAGVVLEGPDGVMIEQSLRFAFKASNNQAEYEALMARMKLAKEMEVKDLRAKSDSQLVTNQVSGEFQAKDPQLIKYLEGVQRLAKCFNSFELVYVPREQNARAEGILEEVHEGACGNHIGERAFAGKILRTDEPLKSVLSPWPFFMWCVDIVGPFPIGTKQARWIILAVDYFTKWVEAEPVSSISAEQVKIFYWKKIICRFGLPKYIVSDNGTQFASEKVIKFCRGKGIQNTFVSVEHPQANGQAESANKVILRALKRKLESKGEAYVAHLSPILWSYHTTPQCSTGEAPYTMVYGSNAMIPVEINPPSWRRETSIVEESSEALRENLDMIEELREKAHFREFAVKQRVARRYNSRVIRRWFREGDLVLKRAMGKDKGGKFASNWEGPFRINEAFEGGAYRLETLDRAILPRTWNITNLKFYYS
ncbi:hypothetical protein L195_g013398, partial [Trifolium pratense]